MGVPSVDNEGNGGREKGEKEGEKCSSRGILLSAKSQNQQRGGWNGSMDVGSS